MEQRGWCAKVHFLNSAHFVCTSTTFAPPFRVLHQGGRALRGRAKVVLCNKKCIYTFWYVGTVPPGITEHSCSVIPGCATRLGILRCRKLGINFVGKSAYANFLLGLQRGAIRYPQVIKVQNFCTIGSTPTRSLFKFLTKSAKNMHSRLRRTLILAKIRRSAL